MQPIQQSITGNEQQGDRSSPDRALVHFYCAFNSRNLAMMSDNWANSDNIVMDNPLGGIKRGWTEIESVYKRIFQGSAEVYVEYFDYTIDEVGAMFYTTGREREYYRLEGKEITLNIRTSRIFRKIDGYWNQIHHHGSIDSPELLNTYQQAVNSSN